MTRQTFPSGSYIRGGASIYMNLIDYQYFGGGRYKIVNPAVPSYRAQGLETMITTKECKA